MLSSGWTGQGPESSEFEREFSAHHGFRYGVFLSSATAGLHASVKILRDLHDIEAGKEVLTTPITFVSTNHSILYSQLVPKWVDVSTSLCIDPEKFRSCISRDTRLALYVGMGGNDSGYESTLNYSREASIPLIYDAAHSAGSSKQTFELFGKPDIAVYSFQAVKNLPTGDSGMILTDDVEIAERIRKFSWLGISKSTLERTNSQGKYMWDYDVDHLGFKYNGNDLVAAVARVALRHLEIDNSERRENFKLYEQTLAGNSVFKLIPHANELYSSRHLIQIECSIDRSDVISFLAERKIQSGVHYKNNLEHSVYRDLRGQAKVPIAEKMSSSVLSLPNFVGLGEDRIVYVANQLKKLGESYVGSY